MRRKKDNKRVLRAGNGGNSSKKWGRNKRSYSPKPQYNNPRNKKKRKSNGRLVFIMIIALVAFVIGAGIGISLSFDDGTSHEPRFENVTKEMTSNLNNTTQVIFDGEADDIDFNENQTSQLAIQFNNTQYNTYSDDDSYSEEDYY